MTEQVGDQVKPVGKRKRRRRRIALLVVGVLFVVLALAVVLAPAIGSSMAPGIIRDAVEKSIAGKITVSRVSLSWFGSQKIGPVTIVDDQGKQVATINIAASRGLFGLVKGAAAGPMDLGNITLSGEATIVRGSDGRTSIDHLLKPPAATSGPATGSGGGGAGKPSEPTRLPKGLAGTVNLDKLNVRLIDEGSAEGVREIALKDVTAQLSLANGSAKLTANAPAFFIDKNSPPRAAGSAKIDASITNFVDASGALTLESAQVNATIDASDLSTEIAGILSGLGNQLAAGLGETAKVSIRAKGGLSEGDATVTFASKGLNADIGLRSAKGEVVSSRPGTVSISGAVIRALAPTAEASLVESGLTIDAMPDVAMTLDSLSVLVPTAARPFNLTDCKATVGVRTTAATGKLAIAGQPVKRIEVAPLIATVDARDWAAGAVVKAQTNVKLDGAAAGTVGVDLVAKNLLTPDGKPQTGLPQISGKAELSNLSTAAAQPFVESAGLNLPAGVGPIVNVTVTATPVTEAGKQRSDFDVRVGSNGVNGSMLLTLDGSTLRSRDKGGAFSLKSPAALIGKAAANSGVQLSTGGFASATIRSFSMALAGGSPLDSIAADVDISCGGFSVVPTSAAAPDPVMLNQVIVTAKMATGVTPAATLEASGSHAGGDFYAKGDMQLAGLITTSGGVSKLTPASVRPIGTIQINNLPTSLAAFAGMERTKDLDPVQLIRDAIGPAVTIVVRAAAKAGDAGGRDYTLTTTAKNLSGSASASHDAAALSIAKADFRTTISPELAASLFDAFGPKLDSKPALAGPAAIVLSTEPFTIPMAGLEPNLARAGDLSLKLGLEGKTTVRNVKYTDQDGRPRDVGQFSLQDILLKAKVPLAAFTPGGGSHAIEASIAGLVLGEDDKHIADLNGSVQGNVKDSMPVGQLKSSLTLALQDSARLDAILAHPGLVSGAVGEKLELKATATASLPETAATEGSLVQSLKKAALDFTVTSPRVTTTRPLKATADTGKIVVESPMVLTWKVDPAWANQYALAPATPAPGAKPDPSPLRLVNSPTLTVSLLKLAVPTGPDEGPMKPGVFVADVQFSSPEIALGAGESRATFKSFMARVTGGREPGVIGFSIRAEDFGAGGAPLAAGTPAMLFEGGIYNLADAKGNLTSEVAQLSMKGDAFNAPTAILDAMAHQGGMLAEALGPTVTLNVRTEGVSEQKGKLIVKAMSPRAEAEIKGTVVGGVFRTEGEPTITLKSVSPELGRMLVQGMPFIGTFEKLPEDGPAIIKARALSIPIDGQVQRLNGDVTIDFGTAHFETGKVFGALLKIAGQKDRGTLGRRLDPLTLTIRNGVIDYPRWKVPVGEFNLDARGTVDLVNRRMDLVTYIPFGALTDEAAGKLNTGLGRLISGAVPLLEQATMIPFHTTGSFDDPKTEPDLQLYVKEAGRTLLRPDRLIKEGIQDIFKRDKKDEKK